MEPTCRSASLTVSPSIYLAVASVSPSSLTSTGVAWSFRKSANLGAHAATALWNCESTMKIRYFPSGTHRKVVRGSAKVLKEHDSRSVKYWSTGASIATISPRWLGNPRTFTETMDVFRLTTIVGALHGSNPIGTHRERVLWSQWQTCESVQGKATSKNNV